MNGTTLKHVLTRAARNGDLHTIRHIFVDFDNDAPIIENTIMTAYTHGHTDIIDYYLGYNVFWAEKWFNRVLRAAIGRQNTDLVIHLCRTKPRLQIYSDTFGNAAPTMIDMMLKHFDMQRLPWNGLLIHTIRVNQDRLTHHLINLPQRVIDMDCGLVTALSHNRTDLVAHLVYRGAQNLLPIVNEFRGYHGISVAMEQCIQELKQWIEAQENQMAS